MNIILQILLLALGFVMLVKGADWFVDGACCIAEKFHIPQLIIGLTIVAMGTSAPEAAVSITSAFKGAADITIGNIVGCNILNILIILGLSAIIVPLKVAKSTIRIEIPFLITISAILLIEGLDGTISFLDGAILILCFLLYLAYLLYSAIKHPAEDEEGGKKLKLWQALLALVIGMVLIVWGSDVAVDAATEIARIMGLSERFIGLTIVALGTSLPELITTITSLRKGRASLGVGNVIGANVFNLVLVSGVAVSLAPFDVPCENYLLNTGLNLSLVFDIPVMLGVMSLMIFPTLASKKLARWQGVALLGIYAAFCVCQFML